METITRANLAEAIYAQVGLSRNESADLLENVLERISAVLEAGESVVLAAIRKQALKCRSCRARCFPSVLHKY